MAQTGPKEIKVNRAQNRITKEDLLFGGQKKKTVNIMDDEDFPEIDEGADPFAAFDTPSVKPKPKQNNRPQTRGPKQMPKKTDLTEQWGMDGKDAPT